MKKLSLSVIAMMLIALVGEAFGQSAQEAIEALQKLDSRVEVGISYRDYGPVLGDTNFKIKQYLDNPESNKDQKLKESISKAFGHYVYAGKLWQIRFAGSGSSDLIPKNSQIGQLLTKDYPLIVQSMTNPRYFTYSSALSVIWHEGAKETQFAVKLLSLQQGTKK